MARCPRCGRPITLAMVLFAVIPFHVTCPACQTRLEGNTFVILAAILTLGLSLFGGAGLVALARSFDLGLHSLTLLLFCGAGAVAVPHALVSLKWGEFSERE